MKISINQFQRGKTTSPYTANGAFWKSQNLDIHGQEGIARINYKPTGHVGTGDGAVQSIITSFTSFLIGTSAATVFADMNKPVKKISFPSTTARVGNANFNAYYVTNWKGYVLAAATTTLKATLINTAMDAAWTDVSTGLENMTNHKMLHSLADGHLYICNKNKVARLVEDTTFDPASGATFTFTAAALTMDSGWQVESIENFGRFLALFVDIKGQNRTGIFLWDRSSGEFDAMFEIGEPRMTRTLEHHGDVYVTGGNQGNIYKLTESGLRKFTQIKMFDYDNQSYIETGGKLSYQTLTFSTMAVWKDKLMVIANVVGTTEEAGIYSVDLKTGGVNHEFNVSDGYKDQNTYLGSIASVGDYLTWGWFKGSDYKIDSVRDDANRVGSYACYFETPLLRAGAKLQKNSILRIEAILARPLQTDEGVRLKYRKNINDSWTTLGTKDFTTNGAQSSLVFPGIPNIENIQLKCELTTGAASKNTPYLQELILF